MTLSTDGESHDINMRRMAGINYSVAVPNRNATLRATDLLIPTYEAGFTTEYYQEIEKIINKFAIFNENVVNV